MNKRHSHVCPTCGSFWRCWCENPGRDVRLRDGRWFSSMNERTCPVCAGLKSKTEWVAYVHAPKEEQRRVAE